MLKIVSMIDNIIGYLKLLVYFLRFMHINSIISQLVDK